MVEVIPKHIKDVWDQWNIRGSVILSLTLQAILICFSPLRKRTPRSIFIMLIWSSYLLADWAANFAVGLISKNQGKYLKPDDPPQDKKLMALWAPFLLLHLGGPDTITAFALEDNALWLRHVFGFVFQVIAGAYAVVMSLPNSLWVIILLVFISGTIKYLERTIALHDASLDNFRESNIRAPYPGADYAKLMDQYVAKKKARLPTQIILVEESIRRDRIKKVRHPKIRGLFHLEIAQYAYNTFKSHVVNSIFSLRERDDSVEFFGISDAEEALRIIEIELGFLYNALYTKTPVLHTFSGIVSRIVAFVTLVAAFILFEKRPKKDIHFHGADVVVTYTLFAVGIAFELISIIPFLFSDWTCVALTSLKEKPVKELTSRREKAFNWLLGQRKLCWMKQVCNHKCTRNYTKPCTFIKIEEGVDLTKKKEKVVEECSRQHHVLTTNFFLRRWYGSINVFNFIAYATKAKANRIHDSRGTIHRYSSNMIAFLFEKLNFIIQEVFGWIFKLINDVHRWISHKVHALARKHPLARVTIYPLYCEFISSISHLIKSVWDFFSEFFELDMLHKTLYVHGEPMTKELWEFIFQEIKYKSTYGDRPAYAKMISLSRGKLAFRDDLPENLDRDKLLRYVTEVDYDQSLLLWHIATELCYQQEEQKEEMTIPNSLDTNERDHYSYREFSKIISDYMMYLLILQPGLMSEVAGIGKIRFRDTLAEAEKFFQSRHIENMRSVREATINIMDVNIEIEPIYVKGVRSKSVLFEASKLAKDLEEMEKTHNLDKWKILSKVWVELLCYAASRCDATAQVKQLSRGGELINFVWILMAHFGLTTQFQITLGDISPKLVVGK